MGLPYTLELSHNYYLKLAIILFIVLASVASLFIYTSKKESNSQEFIYAIILVVFVLLLVVGAIIPEAKKRFKKIHFTHNQIKAIPFLGKAHTYDASNISFVRIEEREGRLFFLHRTKRMPYRLWTKKTVLYPVIIRFNGGKEFIISEREVKSFGYSSMALKDTLLELYKHNWIPIFDIKEELKKIRLSSEKKPRNNSLL